MTSSKKLSAKKSPSKKLKVSPSYDEFKIDLSNIVDKSAVELQSTYLNSDRKEYTNQIAITNISHTKSDSSSVIYDLFNVVIIDHTLCRMRYFINFDEAMQLENYGILLLDQGVEKFYSTLTRISRDLVQRFFDLVTKNKRNWVKIGKIMQRQYWKTEDKLESGKEIKINFPKTYNEWLTSKYLEGVHEIITPTIYLDYGWGYELDKYTPDMYIIMRNHHLAYVNSINRENSETFIHDFTQDFGTLYVKK